MKTKKRIDSAMKDQKYAVEFSVMEFFHKQMAITILVVSGTALVIILFQAFG